MPGKDTQKFSDFLSRRGVSLPMWFYPNTVSMSIGASSVAMLSLFSDEAKRFVSEEQTWPARFLQSYAACFFVSLIIMMNEHQQKIVAGLNGAAVMASDILEDFESVPEFEAIKSKLVELENAVTAALPDEAALPLSSFENNSASGEAAKAAPSLSDCEGGRGETPSPTYSVDTVAFDDSDLAVSGEDGRAGAPSPTGAKDVAAYSLGEGEEVNSICDQKIQNCLCLADSIAKMAEADLELLKKKKNGRFSDVEYKYYVQLYAGLNNAIEVYNYHMAKNGWCETAAKERTEYLVKNIKDMTSDKLRLKFIIEFLVKDRFSNSNYNIIMLPKLLEDEVFSALVCWVENKKHVNEAQSRCAPVLG